MTDTNEKVYSMIKEIVGDQSKDFQKDTNLFDYSILDSFGLIQLVGEIDNQFNVSIRTEDLTTQNFSSVNEITKLISKYKEEK